MGWGCTIRSGQMLFFNFIIANGFKKGNPLSPLDLLKVFIDEGLLSISSLLDKNSEIDGEVISQWT